MSYTNLVLFEEDGNAQNDEVEFKNAHGGVMAIWNWISWRCLKKDIAPISGDAAEFWSLWKDSRLTPGERIAFMFTFDHLLADVAICGEDLIKGLEEVGRGYREAFPNRVNHVESWAQRIQDLMTDADRTLLYVGVYATSCGENPWMVEQNGTCEACGCNCESEYDGAYNVLTGDRHGLLSEAMEEANRESAKALGSASAETDEASPEIHGEESNV